jgi:hypothetical protein
MGGAVIVHVARDPGIQPGGTQWFQIADDEIVFMVSAEGVTDIGARALEAVWTATREPGDWHFDTPVGDPATAAYYRQEWDEGAIVHLVQTGAHCDVYLSPCHFSEGSTRGIQRAASDLISHFTIWSLAASMAS